MNSPTPGPKRSDISLLKLVRGGSPYPPRICAGMRGGGGDPPRKTYVGPLSRPPLWVLVLAAAAFAVWVIFLGTLAVLHMLG